LQFFILLAFQSDCHFLSLSWHPPSTVGVATGFDVVGVATGFDVVGVATGFDVVGAATGEVGVATGVAVCPSQVNAFTPSAYTNTRATPGEELASIEHTSTMRFPAAPQE